MEYSETTSLKDQLSRMPEKKQELSTLFSTPFQQVQSEIIAARVYDVNTFLRQYIHGNLPIDTTDNLESPRDPGEEGWFMTEAITNNSIWNNTEAFPHTDATFTQELYKTTESLQTVPLQSAFIKHIAPSLQEDWLEIVKPVVKEYDLVDTDVIIFQHFIKGLAERLQYADQRKLTTSSLVDTHYKDPYTKVFVDLFKDKTQVTQSLEFFRNACRDRAGVIVGFNRNLLKYPYVIEKRDGSYLAAERELFIKPPQGKIDLLCIAAAETLGGPYEEELLQSLGIVS